MSPELLHHLLTAPSHASPCASVQAWWPLHGAICARWADPFARAVAGGFAADRVAWAFGAGYQAALRVLDPTIPDDTIACLCVTEVDGNTPRAVRALLAPAPGGFVLSGHKKWTTLGPAGALLLVVARLADELPGERPRLKVARVRAPAPGLGIVTMPATRFVPEMPHAEVHLEGVVVSASDLLPGDGYDAVVKPFRTMEDIHVNAAILGYLIGAARRDAWPLAFVAQALASLDALAAAAGRDAGAPATHVALEGALTAVQQTAAAADAHFAAGIDQESASRWQRDRALFGVAGKARAARFARAIERLGMQAESAR